MSALTKLVAVLAIATVSMQGSDAFAQLDGGTLEKDYANLCANKPAPESETCATLKRALMAKLSGGASATPSAVAPTRMTTPAPLTPDQLRERWGYLADSIGKTYFSTTPGLAPSIETYRWEVPGQWIVITPQAATKAAGIHNNPDCPNTKIHLRFDAQTGLLETWTTGPCDQATRRKVNVQADGSKIDPHPDGKHRNRSWRNADGSLTRVTEELKRNGVWKPMAYGTRISQEMTPQFLAQLRGGSDGGGLLGMVQGAIAGASGMANGGGGADAAIAGAAAGAVAGAAGVDASSIQTGFQQGASEVNASNAEMERSFERRMASAGAPGYGTAPTKASSSAALVAGASNAGSHTEAFVACNLYGQYPDGKQWEFYVSRIGRMQTGTGEAWPDSPSDPIAQAWGNYLRSIGADLGLLASQGVYSDDPVCHGFTTEAEAAQSRAAWISGVRPGGKYVVHELDWAPSGTH